MGRLTAPNFADCLTVGEAADFLGVSTATLRNWDRTGKLTPRRHPQNGYRIYLHEDLEAVLRSADLSTLADENFAPQVDWTQMGDTEHFVQFYENDAYLIESVSGFVSASLDQDGSSIVVLTPEHRHMLERRLAAKKIDVPSAIAAGKFFVWDAEKTLANIMTEGSIDAQRMNDMVGEMLGQLTRGGRRLHAFGEMVAILWADGNFDAAIQLEELWAALSKKHRFAIFCAYPIASFDRDGQAAALHGICDCHSRVIPAESYTAITTPDQRLRAITLLQQKAQSLEAEIEHRKAVEIALSNRERELADFFENATEGIHKVGPDGTILWANKADYELLGYNGDEYIGRSITEFHADEDVIAEMLDTLRDGGTLINRPARLCCKDGSIKHVLISSNACFGEGQFAYTRCFTRDVTKQWEAERSLVEADRRKDAFLATLSHELRNPLAPIKNALEVLREDASGETATEARSVVERQVRQLTRLVDDLLDVSRITRDKIELRKERVELSTIVKDAVETSRPLIDAAGHKLTVSLPDRPVLLNIDPARIAQAVSNLLNNSAKYTQSGGRIDLQAKRHGRFVDISVRDNGAGIARDALAYVFDMFRQVDESLERAQDGLGIGLTLVRRLVELHGGTVNVLSEGPGKGSEFTVRLPVLLDETVAADRSPPRKAAAPSAVSKHRILVVDDNKDSGDTLSLLLRVKGHDVCTARDGVQAIELVEQFHPTVILMDVGMPKLNGYDATKRIRQMPGGADIVIVALTGWGAPEDLERSALAGCSAHLVKPVDIQALDRLLAETL